MAPGKSSLHSSCEGERGIALQSWQGNQASRLVEERISSSFSSCRRKPCSPLTFDSDLRELLMVPWESRNTVELGVASRDSTRFDEMKEGLISIGGRNLRLPLHF